MGANKRHKNECYKRCKSENKKRRKREKREQEARESLLKKSGSGKPNDAIEASSNDVESTHDRESRWKQYVVVIAGRPQEPAAKTHMQLVPPDPTASITFDVPERPPPDQSNPVQPKTDAPEDQTSSSDMEDRRTSLGGRWNTFVQLPETLQKALQSKQLDHVNRVIGGLDISEAEKIVHNLERAGLLCFQ